MDAYNVLMFVVVVLLAMTIIGLLYSVFKGSYKQYLKDSAPTREDFRFIFNHKMWNIKCPVLNSSVYWDRFPSRCDMWEYMPTIDCFAMRELANTIKSMTEGKDDRYKAEFILAMVQQNCRYVSDPELYGYIDRHAFPVCTAYLKKGDCEDSAVLGACLSTLCGIDTILCLTPNHMGYAVNVEGKGYRINLKGKSYLWCETTNLNEIGKVNNAPKVQRVFIPMMPSTHYLEDYTEFDEFDQYLDGYRE